MQITRQLHYRLRRVADKRGMDLSTLVNNILHEKFGNVELTSEDYKQIYEATKVAERTRRRIATQYVSAD